MRLHLLRHGQSHANVAGLVTGFRDDALTALGREQAGKAAALRGLYGLHFSHFFISDWRRAQETAAAFLPWAVFTVEPRLGETDAGLVAGWLRERFVREHPEHAGPIDPAWPYPGGESHQQLYDRVTQWFSQMQNTLPGDAEVLAVTHAGPICCLTQHVCGLGMRNFPLFLADNASLTRLDQIGANTWRLGYFSLTAPEGVVSDALQSCERDTP